MRRGWAGFTSWPIATRVASSSAVVLGVLAVVLLVALASWRSYGEQVAASRSETQDQLAETEEERDELAGEVDALTSEVDGLREDLADAEDQIEAAEQRAEDAEETARAELRDEVEAEFEDREAELAARAEALQQRADELDAREADISQAEQREEMSTFGSGVWAVGDDILPGQYRAADAGGNCYWARLHQDGSSIIDNHYSGEPGPRLGYGSRGGAVRDQRLWRMASNELSEAGMGEGPPPPEPHQPIASRPMEAVRLYGEPSRGDELPALPEWREYAACRDEPSDTFFDETAEGVAEARRICADCPVRGECQREALAMPWLVGVFGGLTQMERLQMRRGEPVVDQPRAKRSPPAAPQEPKPRPEPQPCGTTAAYARHRRNGEDACAECKEARRLKSAEVKRQRRERAREAHEGQDAPEAA